MMNKRELYKLLEKLESAKRALSHYEFMDRGDQYFVKEVITRDLNEAISTAEYLQELAS